MENSKIAKILSTLSKAELKDFGKFLRSPWCNTSERGLENTFEIIKRYYPEFTLSREELYSELYPGKPYNEKTIKNIFTDMYKMAEEFLCLSSFRRMKTLSSNVKAEALLLKNLGNEYLKASEDSKRILNEEKIGSEDYFINYRRYHQLKMSYGKSFYKDKEETEHILNSIEYLAALLLKDLFNVLVNKQLSGFLHSESNESEMLNSFFKSFDLDKFMTLLEKIDHKFYPFIAIRYYLYKDLCESENLEYFHKLKEIVYSHIDEFSIESQFEATWAIINSCAMTSRRTNPALRRESLNALKLQLSKGLQIAPGSNYYSVPAFNQFLTEALFFREYDLIEKVIEEHSHELEPGIRDDMTLWAYATLNFEKDNFEDALKYASKINFKEPNFKVQSKFLLFRIFYHMDLPEQALSIINTSLHALKLDDLSKEVKSRYETSFKTAIKLVRLKNNFSEEEAYLLKKKIEPLSFIGKNWMIKMINALS